MKSQRDGNDTIDMATLLLQIVKKHLKEKDCKHSLKEVVKEWFDESPEYNDKK